MEYSDFDRRIMTQNDLEHYKKIFEKDIQDRRQKLDSFIQRGIERLEWIQTCEKNKEYRIFGGMHKHGRQKEILCIVRYPDGTQRDERYSFSKISDAREKLKEFGYLFFYPQKRMRGGDCHLFSLCHRLEVSSG